MNASPQRISFFKPRPENRCVYCNATSYGYGCRISPTGLHYHPNDPFTPDGILVGTLGEVLAEEKYDLELLPPKTEAFDATDCRGSKVQIRCNQRNTTPIKKGATKEMFLALKLLPNGTIEEIVNAPASIAHRLTEGRKADSAGFVSLSHKKLCKLMESVPQSKRIPLRNRPKVEEVEGVRPTWTEGDAQGAISRLC